MSFFIEERETLLGDVRTDVVKFESSVDSRNLHCQTNIIGPMHDTCCEVCFISSAKITNILVINMS